MPVDLWDLASKQVTQEQGNLYSASSEKTVLLVGERKAGKTTLLQNFLMQTRDDAPKATVALEYSFARAPLGITSKRDIGHLYELGGGRMLANLISVPITRENIGNLLIVIALDLSHPYRVLDSLLYWFTVIKDRVNECFASLEPAVSDRLTRKLQKVWGEHPDRNALDLLKVPVIVVGCKYDIFCDEESEKRKWMARCLRYFCHKYGASLYYSSYKDSRLTSVVRCM